MITRTESAAQGSTRFDIQRTGKALLCTLGPASMNEGVVTRLAELGVSLFRINLSHTKTEDIAPQLEFLQSLTAVPICLDTEGAQVRTGSFADGKIVLRDNRIVHIQRQIVPGDSHNFNLYPQSILDDLVVGDLLRLDAVVLARVVDIAAHSVAVRVLCGGELGSNKAVTIERDIALPALTKKDADILAIGKDMGVLHVALSFANRAADVDEIRSHCHPDVFVISKIECLNGLKNLDEIAAKSDALLIDRGDLSRQVPIEQLPKVQKNIIARAKQRGRHVYVATNLLESMVTSSQPTRAEVNDVYNTLVDGADGLVLAAETAIGDYPVGCAGMIVKMIREFDNGHHRQLNSVADAPISLLIDPHGGHLVNRELADSRKSEIADLRRLTVSDTDILDCELIANGTYSPLTGFMSREALNSVLDEHRLPSGVPWTMPILLQVETQQTANVEVGESIALTSASGKLHAILEVAEIYSMPLDELAASWFQTSSASHPGVARLLRGGNRFLAGNVSLVRGTDSPLNGYKLTPAAARFIFAQKGWSRVVGFHGRNVPHRVHEHIQLNALHSTHADGLFICPIIGPRKAGDFLPDPIMKGYQLLIDFGFYPRGQVVLSCLATYPRYCGPREAVFTAICHKNTGCSHFIVGRDHAGVGGFYQDTDTRRLFGKLEDVGITPVFFDNLGYDRKTKRFRSQRVCDSDTHNISGTIVRERLRNGHQLPSWYMRELVQEMIRTELASGASVFCE